MRTILRSALLFPLVALLCSCSSISVVDTWRNPNLQPARLHKVLVVSITRKDSNRAVYEDVLASELAKHGVEAVASHTVMPGDLKGEATILDQAVKKAAAEAVLTVQTIKVERQTTTTTRGTGIRRPFPAGTFTVTTARWLPMDRPISQVTTSPPSR